MSSVASEGAPHQSPFADHDVVCGTSTHQIQMDPEACTVNKEDCKRTYHLYIPDILCDADKSKVNHSPKEIGHLPLVFAVHCFGCHASNMIKYEEIAKEFSFVLVRPEGIRQSWNARYCCGYALDQNLDDMGFFDRIITDLDMTFEFVDRDMVYGVGWSNGGYMVTYSASLFRSIAPISGYQYHENDIAPILGSGTGLFQHHSLNDPMVSYDGCCDRSKCCCRISKFGENVCTNVDQAFNLWASAVNECSEQTRITYTDKTRGIQCHSREGCTANTTLCIYEHDGHFTSNFPMYENIGDFFARDACTMQLGQWDSGKRFCSCSHAISGDSLSTESFRSKMMYCSNLKALDEAKQQEDGELLSSTSMNVPVQESGQTSMSFVSGAEIFVFLLTLIIFLIYWKQRMVNLASFRKKGYSWRHLPTEEEPNEIELAQKL